MKKRNRIAWILTGLFAVVSVTCAEKEKKQAIGDFPFWAGKGEQKVGQHVAGLNAVLKLTDDQIQLIHAVTRETTGSEIVQTAARKLKAEPNAPEAEREAARKLLQQAHATLHERVAKILTEEQRALIRQIDQFHSEVQTAVMEEFQARFAAAKVSAEEMQKLKPAFRAKLEGDFLQRLDQLLSTPQRTALAQAMADEKAAALVKKPKP